MPYPPRYIPLYNYAAAKARGETVDGTRVQLDLSNIAETLNQVRDFLKAGFDADKTWKPLEYTARELEEQLEFTATASQTQFDFPSGTVADVSTDQVRVYSDGVLIAPSLVTLAAGSVTIPAQTSGTTVVVELFNDAESVRTDLASTANAKGASLVGVEDAAGNYDSSTTEDVLAEIGTTLDSLRTDLDAISGAILKDGSVDFEADQSMGGSYKITDAADGTADGDYVTVRQLDTLSAILGDLDQTYLALTGGTMQGAINMGGYRVTNSAAATADSGLTTKGQVDDLVEARLHLTGTKQSSTEGTLTGPVSFGTEDDTDADIDQTAGGAPANVSVATLYGVPNPTSDHHASNKRYVDEQVATVAGAPSTIGGTGVDGEFTDTSTISSSGRYFFSSALRSTALTLPAITILNFTEGGSISAALTASQWPSTEAPGLAGFRLANSGEQGTFAGGLTYYSGGAGYADGYADATATVDGGTGYGNADSGLANYARSALSYARYVGGRPGSGLYDGGGILGIYSDGALNLTNATLSANGETPGGGGGQIFIVCLDTVTITGATFSAVGGLGGAGTGQGGGGLVTIVAPAVVGEASATFSVDNGAYLVETMPAATIASLFYLGGQL